MLIVDDEADVRAVVRRALAREGLQVEEAADGSAARAAVAVATFDVVVLDVGLPDESGLEVLAAIRDRQPGVHVIMLTGSGGEADRVLGLMSGADDYVVKPFSLRELTARIMAVARHRGRAQSSTITQHGGVHIDLVGGAGSPLGDDTSRLRELATGVHTDVSDAVILTADDLTIRSFNRAAEELYGWREADVLGRSIAEVIGGRLGPTLDDDAGRRLVREGSCYTEDVHRRRDGSAIVVRSSTTLLRDEAGASVGLITVNRRVDGHDEPASLRSRDASLDDAILNGIARDEFVVHYQPVVVLENGETSGVEALVRWEHPDRGLLAPAMFIGAAERSGVIVELGHHVLRVACAQAMTWRGAGHDFHMAVNLSARQLVDDRFPDRLAAVMAETRMPADQLWLEMTETALVQDLAKAANALQRIDELGARIVIDDFGTGWASLTYLREFPVHALKIDRSFVSGLGTGSRDEAIVGSMLSLGHELELGVVAEGVETAEQRAILVELGCETAQGYLFGRPQAADVLDLRTLPRDSAGE